MMKVMTKNFLTILMSVLLISLSMVLLKCSKDLDQSRVIARVNHTVLTMNMIKAALPEEMRGHIKKVHIREYMNRWIDTQILYQEALRRQIQNQKDVADEVEKQRRQVIVNFLLEAEFHDTITISDADLKNYYNDNKDQFIRPETMVYFYQIVGASSRDLRQIRSRIMQGEDFLQLVREYSIDSSYQSGGDMGWVKISNLLPKVAEQITRMEKDQISTVFRSDIGYHIIKLIDIRPKDEIQELDEIEPIVRERVKARKRAEKYSRLLAILKDAARIEKNDHIIDELLVEINAEEPKAARD